MPTVSICLCTIDRFDLTTQCVGPALDDARARGINFEFLCCDNGSEDQRTIEYIRSLNPVYHRLNEKNAGYAPMLNQMILRATGEYLCMIDNDILLPSNWLPRLIDANKDIPASGFSGYHCVEGLPPVETRNGHRVHPKVGAFGIKFFNRCLLASLGCFCQDYGRYGLEDCCAFIRADLAGFLNYYIYDPVGAKHLGNDVGENTPYRKFKWAELERAKPIFEANIAKYKADRSSIYIPPPELS